VEDGLKLLSNRIAMVLMMELPANHFAGVEQGITVTHIAEPRYI
jgi:hypothetical protein